MVGVNLPLKLFSKIGLTKITDQRVYGFDSFVGLTEPRAGTGAIARTFSWNDWLPRVPKM
jgi:hypothetical protein